MTTGSAFSSLITEIVQVDGQTKAKLYYPMAYTRKGGDVITVPAGFVSDFASIPRPLWPFLPRMGPYSKSAVVHDFLVKKADGYNKPRLEADKLFLEAMIDEGVAPPLARMMYRAVRLNSTMRGLG